jgi:hypothetical protein
VLCHRAELLEGMQEGMQDGSNGEIRTQIMVKTVRCRHGTMVCDERVYGVHLSISVPLPLRRARRELTAEST